MLSEAHIDDLMKYYQKHWPDATILPKLHMLQNHDTDFISKWRFGFRFKVNNVENQFTQFNKLKQTYCVIQPGYFIAHISFNQRDPKWN